MATATRTRQRWQDDPASMSQAHKIGELARERVIPDVPANSGQAWMLERIAATYTDLTKGQASMVIDWLLDQPRIGQAPRPAQDGHAPASEPRRGGKPEAGPGVYCKDGRIYVVKPTRSTAKLPEAEQRCYASELVELPGRARRLTASGDEIPFELQLRKGFVYELTEADRMPAADVEQLIIVYRRCIICSHGLSDPKSVRRGIGPVCGKYIR